MGKGIFLYKPVGIVRDKRLSPLEQDYLCLIAQLQNAKGCTASNRFFAEYFGAARVRAVAVISGLKKKSFIASTEKKHGKKTIERAIFIIDPDSKKALLRDSNENDTLIVTKTNFDSNKTDNPIIDITTDITTDIYPPPIGAKLSQVFLNKILERKKDFKKPNLTRWSKVFGQMLTADGRKAEVIRAVIEFCQADRFWQNVVLSPDKLRKQFDRLELQMNKPKNRERPKIEWPTEEEMKDLV